MARSHLLVLGIVLVLSLASCGFTRSEAVQVDDGDAPAEELPSDGDAPAEELSSDDAAAALDESGPPPTALPARPDIASKGNPTDVAASMTFADGATAEITFEQLDDVVQPTLDSAQYRILAEQVPDTFDTEVLRQMLLGEVLQAELAARGAEVTDAESTEVEDELVANISGALANQTNDPQADRSEEAANLIQEVPFLGLLVDLQARERALLGSLEETSEPGQVPCISQILLDSEESAQEIADEINGGADFGETAVEKSLDPNAAESKGVLGCFDPGQLPEPFIVAVEEATVGEITPPVQTEAGWHIILVTGNELEEIDPAALAQREFESVVNDRFEGTEVTVDPKLGTWDKEQNSLVPA